ncbi:hypothetical protein E2C01_025907 [Portunus trituberculatus]|uniref:Uncharacterized protein n=1 Tax=Portunus trituberculatus TaxID=210409 RepID=A0A5B7EE68_PORTR|nr:hypothetical protein [Portunus trituberculatus]
MPIAQTTSSASPLPLPLYARRECRILQHIHSSNLHLQLLTSTHLARVSTLTERAGGDGVEHEAVVTPKTTQHLPAAPFHSLPVAHHQLTRRGSGGGREAMLC